MSSPIEAFPLRLNSVDITITATSTVSSSADLYGNRIVGIIFPTMTGATCSMQASVDGTNFYDLYDDSGNAVSITATDGKMILFEQVGLENFRYIKLTSAGAESATRTIKLIVKP